MEEKTFKDLLDSGKVNHIGLKNARIGQLYGHWNVFTGNEDVYIILHVGEYDVMYNDLGWKTRDILVQNVKNPKVELIINDNPLIRQYNTWFLVQDVPWETIIYENPLN